MTVEATVEQLFAKIGQLLILTEAQAARIAELEAARQPAVAEDPA